VSPCVVYIALWIWILVLRHRWIYLLFSSSYSCCGLLTVDYCGLLYSCRDGEQVQRVRLQKRLWKLCRSWQENYIPQQSTLTIILEELPYKTDGDLQPEDISSVVSGWQWHISPLATTSNRVWVEGRGRWTSVIPNKGFSSSLQPLLHIW